VAEEGVEARVAARLVGQQIRPAVVRGRAQDIAVGAVDRDPDEVGERLARVLRDLVGLRRVGPEDGRDVDRRVLENRVRRGDGAEVTAGPA